MRIFLVGALALVSVSFGSPNAEARGGGHSGGGHYSGTGSNSSSHYTQGYTTGRGTYVAPHYQTNPNSTQRDNYEARGNVNPHTGAVGNRLVDR